jgi:hypothetical protein
MASPSGFAATSVLDTDSPAAELLQRRCHFCAEVPKSFIFPRKNQYLRTVPNEFFSPTFGTAHFYKRFRMFFVKKKGWKALPPSTPLAKSPD